MSYAALLNRLRTAENFAGIGDFAAHNTDFNAPAGMRAPLIAETYLRRWEAGNRGVLLVIAATSREAEAARQALASLIPDAETIEIPAWETLPHERLSPARETVGRRYLGLAKIRQHAGKTPLVVVISVRAALQAVSPFAANCVPIKLAVGADTAGLPNLATSLAELGYERVDMVAKRGEFAVRGGLLDVFSPAAESAVRIEFWGDEIEQIRQFSVSDQRSATDLAEIELWPARELLLTDKVRQKAAEILTANTEHAENATNDTKQAEKVQAKMLAKSLASLPQNRQMLEKIAAGIPAEGMESLLPYLVEKMPAITELLPKNSTAFVISPEKVATRAVHLAETNAEFLAAAWLNATDGNTPIGEETRYTGENSTKTGLYTLEQTRQAAPQLTWHTISPFGFDTGDLTEPGENPDSASGTGPAENGAYTIKTKQIPQATPGTDPNEHILGYLKTRLATSVVIIAASQTGTAERACELLNDAEIPAKHTPELPQTLETGLVYVTHGAAQAGFDHPGSQTLFLSETEFFGRQLTAQNQPEKAAKMRRRGKNIVDPLQLKTGDYVVHETHGIGRFIELIQKTATAGIGRGATKTQREYLVLEYAASKRGMPADRMYVPTDQLGQLSKYVGGDAPALSKMGGSDWANAKKKARKAVREIAIELVKLYAERKAARGHAFAPDTPWQAELESAFPYAETADQLTAIADVKRDMERHTPMDRLISGDVGFGKTEIAVRAAFKAVQDGKQVAVLVPTTLLVQQHYETFQRRFAGFPVQVRPLSRFQTEKETRDTLQGLETGAVDVIIGTHRLLSKDIKYRDLGLIVIDEEQRFGVEHKESLKVLKHNVDVLSMSATPIPRTLEMAVTGIREMSQLTTAPEDRHPILTFVGQDNEQQVAAAIRRELLREGQVFYVHNRVSSIHRLAKKIAENVPEARVAVAHGKLSQHALEQVVLDFWERKYDVLVCTTIVETGLDIANANTIIVDGADKYGLSQLHQLRGRVGRGRERAYAYFLYPPDRVLTETAHERLETIAANNELGSGMQIALKDLELRGAGNLLGGEQSGHIAGVGFDLYLRMIGEAVNAFKGETVHENTELQVELPVAARIPESYIDSERLRLEAYQKLAAAAHPNAAEESIGLVLDELRDRYGAVPDEVLELAELAGLRRLAAQAGIARVAVSQGFLRLSPLNLPASRQMRLERLYPGSVYQAERVAGRVGGGAGIGAGLGSGFGTGHASDERKGAIPHFVQVPLPSGLSGSGVTLGSPFDRAARAADQAEDGNLVGWVMRVLQALLAE
ncbi:MAG: transcription-repair coupling factor [Microbacteriaceae bacterium]|nr:transcription-repair coupling factor [Microbacteriaceae bacterium]